MSFQFSILLIFWSLLDPTLYNIFCHFLLGSVLRERTASDFRLSRRLSVDSDSALRNLYHLEVSHGTDVSEEPAVSIYGVEVSVHVTSFSVHKTTGRRGGIYRPVLGGTGPEQGTVNKKQGFKCH
jgi:hypothetical protein